MSFEVIVYHGGKTWRQKHDVAGHVATGQVAFAARKQREIKAGAQFVFFPQSAWRLSPQDGATFGESFLFSPAFFWQHPTAAPG